MAVINGTAGNNTLTGTNFADTINGLEGNDTINALARSLESSPSARDVVDGGDGIDTLVVDASGETGGITLSTGLSPRFTVSAASNNYYIEAYNMELVKFTGGSGNDFIDTGDSGGTVQGNGGIDTWQADLSALTVNVNFTLGTTTNVSAAGLSSILGIEGIRLTTGLGNDKIVGGAQADFISTGDGDDQLDAKTRPLIGGGSDVLDGGAGTDTLIVDASAESTGVTLSVGFNPGYSVTSVSGNFSVEAYRIEKVKFTGGSGNDSINTGIGALTVNGGGGIDYWQADYSEAASNLTFVLGTTMSLSAVGLTSILNVEQLNLITGLGDDRITGGAYRDVINGGAGDDTFDMKTTTGGAEIAEGGDGIDTLVVDASAETGDVTLSTGFNPGYSVTSVSGHFLIDAYRIEKVKFTGGSGNDSISTGPGAVTVNGGGGIDLWQADYSEAASSLTFVLGTTTSLSAVGLSSILNIEQLTLTTGLGNDTITGGAYRDVINGGAGDDTVDMKTTAGGTEIAEGGDGIDTLVVDASAEIEGVTLSAGFNPGYSVTSLSGHFFIDAYRIEKVKFTGGSGNDSINTGSGGVTVDGGGGTDFWQADLSRLTGNITFVLGTTTAIASAGLTSILGIERINLTLGSGKDTITGGALADSVFGGAGDDTIDMKTRLGGGTDFTDGGLGTDTLIVDASAESQAVFLNVGLSPTYSVDSVSGNFDIDAYSIEKIKFTGGAGDDSINTGSGGVTVDGGAGVDTWTANLGQVATGINFTLGSTTAIGAAGLTSILGIERLNLTSGSGNDIITGGALADFILGGAGNDTINMKTRSGGGVDTADGGLGMDTLIVNASAETLAVSLSVGLSPTYSVDSVSGNFDIDAYSIEKIRFTGGAGDDSINTGSGGVTVDGGAGIDTWIANLAQTTASINFILGSTNSIGAAGLTSILRIERLNLTSGSGSDTITGGALNDFIVGGAGNDTLNAKTRTVGTDIVDGGIGIDTLVVDASTETQSVTMFSGLNPVLVVDSVSGHFDIDAYSIERAIFTGGKGNDTANGLDRDDTLAGGIGSDTLYGADGDDSLDGGQQDDLLRGGRGADLLTGGDGKDVFDYDLVTDSNAVNGKIDGIGDFVAGFDKIDLADIDANSRAVDGNQAFAFIGAAAFGNVRGQLRSVAGLIEADVNGDGAADFRITLTNGATAGAGDFIL